MNFLSRKNKENQFNQQTNIEVINQQPNTEGNVNKLI